MFKKSSQLFSLVFFTIFSIFIGTASAIDLDEATRTVVVDSSGKTIVLTPEQVKRGKRLFNATCGACHVGGVTKTNPNVGLDPEALSLATPRRDNIAGLVDFLKNPTTYDGLESIAEVHPSIKSADIYPRMRSVTDEDLTAMAGHILLQPKIVTEKWFTSTGVGVRIAHLLVGSTRYFTAKQNVGRVKSSVDDLIMEWEVG
jgi:photosystem II cytochrome c550